MVQALLPSQGLIYITYQRILEATAQAALLLGHRIWAGGTGRDTWRSRQPVRKALHLLKRQGLVEDVGRRRLRVVKLNPSRVMQLYRVREAVDGLAARLAADQIAAGLVDPASLEVLLRQLHAAPAHHATTPIPALVRADMNFHRGPYHLSGKGNRGDDRAALAASDVPHGIGSSVP